MHTAPPTISIFFAKRILPVLMGGRDRDRRRGGSRDRAPPEDGDQRQMHAQVSTYCDIWKIKTLEQVLVFFHPKKWIFFVFTLFWELK